MSCQLFFPYEPTFGTSPGESGEANTASNIGGGVELFKTKNLLDLQFRTFVAGDGMSISLSGDTVVFESSGGVSDGTATGNTLRWNGTSWVESNGFRNFNNSFGINTNGNNYTALTISDSALPGGIFGLDIDSHNPVGMRVLMNKISDTNAVGIGVKQNIAGYTGLMLELADSVGEIFSIDYLGRIFAKDLETTTAHAPFPHALFVDSSNGLIYSQAVSAGTITGAENVGTGDGWWKDESAGSLRFKSLTTDSSISVVNNADDLNLSVANPLPAGTSTNDTLRWAGSNWQRTDTLQVDSGKVSINGAAYPTSSFTITGNQQYGMFFQQYSNIIYGLRMVLGGASGVNGYGIGVEQLSSANNGIALKLHRSNNLSVKDIIHATSSTTVTFAVDKDGGIISDTLKASTAHAASYLGLYVDTATGLIYANTDTPSGGGGGISDGTGTGNMLYWNGSAWTENANVQIDGSTFRLKSGYDLVIDNAGEIILKDLDNSNLITLTAPDVVNTDYAVQLPADAPALGQVVRISNAGSGATEWVDLPEIIKVTVTADLPQINVGATYQAFWTVTGAELGGTVAVSPQNGLGADIIISYARVSSTNNIEVRFANIGSSNVDLTSRDFYITVINP